MRDESEAQDVPRSKLKPANENPWYILMTLYGEQEEDEFDGELHEKNRRAWNAWAGQTLNDRQRAVAANRAGIEVAELGSWQKNEKEIVQLFLEACQERRSQQTPSQLPDPTHKFNISEFHITKQLSVMKFVFSQRVEAKRIEVCNFSHFGSSVFLKGADFYESTFLQKPSFRNTKFNVGASFRKVHFRRGATFVSTSFGGKSNFNESAFDEKSNFTSAKFNADAMFAKAEFRADLDFSASCFTQQANFSHSNFSGPTIFDGSSFNSAANFTSSTFQSVTSFDRAIFGGAKSSILDFKKCHFFKSVSFRRAQFCYGYPNFGGAVLHDKTSFTARRRPASDEIVEDENLAELTYWPDHTDQGPETARESCAVIRHTLAKQGLPEDEHFFFRREMYFSGQIGSIWQRLPYLLFGLFSDYGYSIARPALWLAGLWAFGFVAFWGYLAGCCVPAPLEVITRPMGSAMGLSFSNLFPLFGFGRAFFGAEFMASLPPVLKLLSGFQTVASLPLLFFLGLGLRQRFRLR